MREVLQVIGSHRRTFRRQPVQIHAEEHTLQLYGICIQEPQRDRVSQAFKLKQPMRHNPPPPIECDRYPPQTCSSGNFCTVHALSYRQHIPQNQVSPCGCSNRELQSVSKERRRHACSQDVPPMAVSAVWIVGLRQCLLSLDALLCIRCPTTVRHCLHLLAVATLLYHRWLRRRLVHLWNCVHRQCASIGSFIRFVDIHT